MMAYSHRRSRGSRSATCIPDLAHRCVLEPSYRYGGQDKQDKENQKWAC
jgi:hypothetical protein